MGGGLLQLVAKGPQDIYLTGNPSITYFKNIYKHHTNFAIEQIEQTFLGEIDFGKRIRCKIERKADLLANMYLGFKIDDHTDDIDGMAHNIKKIGFKLIDYVEVEIGGQVIDRHYGEWMDIWTQLTYTESKYNNLLALMKDKDSNFVNKSNDLIYVPLMFWFNIEPGLALPLISLQYHEVILYLNISSRDKIKYIHDTIDTSVKVDITDGHLHNRVSNYQHQPLSTNKLGIDDPDHSFILSGEHSSLTDIKSNTSLGLNGGATLSNELGISLDGIDGYITIPASLTQFGSGDFTISFWAECKELASSSANDPTILSLGYNDDNSIILTAENDEGEQIYIFDYGEYFSSEDVAVTGKHFTSPALNFTDTGIGSGIKHFVLTRVDGVVKFFFENTEYISYSSALSLPDRDYHIGYGIPRNSGLDVYPKMDVYRVDIWKNKGYSNVDYIYNTGYLNPKIYSIPISFYNTTSINDYTSNKWKLSNFKGKLENVFLYCDYIFLDTEERKLFANNNHEYLIEQIQRTNKLGLPALTYNKNNNNEQFELDFNHPVKEIIWTVNSKHLDGTHFYKNMDYSDTLENILLQMNGLDRIKVRENNFYNLIQPFQYHSCGGLNNYRYNGGFYLYSFGLKPEKYEPSGTLNFSKLNNFLINFNYKKTSNTFSQISEGYTFTCYGINYNVLKISNGMAGLIYKN